MASYADGLSIRVELTEFASEELQLSHDVWYKNSLSVWVIKFFGWYIGERGSFSLPPLPLNIVI